MGLIKEIETTEVFPNFLSNKNFKNLKENKVMSNENAESSRLIISDNENKKSEKNLVEDTIIKNTQKVNEKLETFDFVDDCGNDFEDSHADLITEDEEEIKISRDTNTSEKLEELPRNFIKECQANEKKLQAVVFDKGDRNQANETNNLSQNFLKKDKKQKEKNKVAEDLLLIKNTQDLTNDSLKQDKELIFSSISENTK